METEEEGFEPPLPFLVNLFSKQTHSATLPLFLVSHECSLPKRVKIYAKKCNLIIIFYFRLLFN
jgi:hypothetical protein